MKTKNLVLLILSFCSISIIAQETVSTTFLRPTVVTFYGLSEDNELQNIALKNLQKNCSLLPRFDELNVDHPKLVLSLEKLPIKPVMPTKPAKPDSTASKKEQELYKKQLAMFNKDQMNYQSNKLKYDNALRTRNKQRRDQINKYLAKYAKNIIGTWFSRDSLGNMDTHEWIERAHYAASDEDINVANSSTLNRVSLIGEELMQKTYITIHTIDEITSYKDYYDNIDRENKIKNKYLNKEFVPILRAKEGLMMKDYSYLYKVTFNDSMLLDFYTNYWLDASNTNKQDRANKLEHWEKAFFPTKFLREYNYSTETYQYTKEYYQQRIIDDPTNKLKYQNKIRQIKPTEEVNKNIGKINFTKSVLSANLKKIEDFKLKATIFSTYPITAKIGTKEGVKKHERWGIYEIHMDIEGNQKKKKTGYARIKNVAKNDTIATGSSPSSIFRQHGGKESYSGMLLEPKHGGIFGIGMGQSVGLNNDQSISGFTFDIDLRFLSSWKIGFNTVSNSFSINNFGGLIRDSVFYSSDSLDYAFGGNLIDDSTSVSGTTGFFSFNFGREFCIGNRGNIVLEPKIGTGFAKYAFNTDVAPDTMQAVIPSSSLYNLYKLSARVTVLSLEIGYHIHPNIVFSFKPMMVNRGTFVTNATMDNDNSPANYRNAIVPNTEGWGFNKLDGSTSFGAYFGIKFKL